MTIYNEEKTQVIENPDLELGYLVNDTIRVHHEAVEGVGEIGHYETVAEYPNGGRDVEWVVEVPGVEGREEYDENVDILIYIPYTEEELRDIRLQPYKDEITTLKKYLSETDYCVIKSIELGSNIQTEYPEEYQKRREARARINELERKIGVLGESEEG